VATTKEYYELYRNKNKITDAVNNSLITTMTELEVIKTQCMAYLLRAMTFKL